MNNKHLYGQWNWNGMKPNTCCNQIGMIINKLDRFEKEMKPDTCCNQMEMIINRLDRFEREMKPNTCCNQIESIINRFDRFEREMKQIKTQLANMNNNYYSSYYNY